MCLNLGKSRHSWYLRKVSGNKFQFSPSERFHLIKIQNTNAVKIDTQHFNSSSAYMTVVRVSDNGGCFPVFLITSIIQIECLLKTFRILIIDFRGAPGNVWSAYLRLFFSEGISRIDEQRSKHQAI